MQHPYRASSAQSVAVMIRQCRMIGFYDHDDHRLIGIQNEPKVKLVVTFRRNSSVWTVLRVMIMYASVDAILLLPILILVNVVSIWHVLSVFNDAKK